MGYGGVQVSPINENLVIPKRPWYERYQPLSYRIITRSGDEAAFKDMVERCNRVGVRIYVDAVINHMSGNQSPAYGTGGSVADPANFTYPAVPYGPTDFNEPCPINDYTNAENMRDCELSGLHDLDLGKEHVRDRIVDFMDRAVDLGVAGFRIDAAKHMWPKDLEVVYGRVKNLSVDAGYESGARPFFYQEVIDLGTEAVSRWEYTTIGRVIDFQFGIVLGNMFGGKDKLSRLASWGGKSWNLPPSGDALVMVDNHDNQRGHGAGGAGILTYKKPREYKTAVAFMLAYPYGTARVMSSFEFDDPSTGPPMDANEEIISPAIGTDGQCQNGWVCEHRWPQIYRMVQFRNLAGHEPVENWWTNGGNQIAFSRGSVGFVAFNVEEDEDLSENLQTGLQAGIYCDVITGSLENGRCTGGTVQVRSDGVASVKIPANAEERVLAIHVKAKL